MTKEQFKKIVNTVRNHLEAGIVAMEHLSDYSEERISELREKVKILSNAHAVLDEIVQAERERCAKIKQLIIEANHLTNVFKLSNNSADNLNEKDRTFLTINKKLVKALQILEQ